MIRGHVLVVQDEVSQLGFRDQGLGPNFGGQGFGVRGSGLEFSDPRDPITGRIDFLQPEIEHSQPL